MNFYCKCFWIACFFGISNLFANSSPDSPTVGIEGRLEATLPGTLLEAKSYTSASTVVLRIADTRKHGNLTYYDLRYIGLIPGNHDLRNYIVRKDGSSTADLPPLSVKVTGLLPEKHLGELVPPPRTPFPAFGGYYYVISGIGFLWCVGLLLLCYRKRKVVVPTVKVDSTSPNVAEQLRPLVIQATEGKLSLDGKAQLERLLLGYWCQELNLQNLTMVEAMGRLRVHPEAGPLLRELENWLHCEKPSKKVDVAIFLAPYQKTPSTSGQELVMKP